MITIITVLFLFITSIEMVYRKNNKLDSDNTFKFKNVPSGIEICNFGSSHGELGFNYEMLEKKYVCFNFGLSAQTLSYDYRLLQNYINNIKNGAIVFIPISYFSLYGTDNGQTNISKDKRYYKIMDKKYIKDYDPVFSIYMKFESIESMTSNLVKTLLNKSEPNYVQINRYNRIGSIEIAKTDVIDVEKVLDTHINNTELTALYNMIDLCREHGATPILLTTPFTRVYNNHMIDDNPKLIEDFADMMKKISNELKVDYYNFSCDKDYIDNYSLFFDCQHLNKMGALTFTDEIMNLIERDGYKVG